MLFKKKCSKCKESKRVDEFFRDVGVKNGIHIYCKGCDDVYKQSHAEEIREANRQYKQSRVKQVKVAHKTRFEKVNQSKKKYKQAHSSEIYNKLLISRTGYTLELKNQMIVEQNGKCVICKRLFSEDTRHIHADHKEVGDKKIPRAVLCADCNITLGKYHEDISLFKWLAPPMAAYLKKYGISDRYQPSG